MNISTGDNSHLEIALSRKIKKLVPIPPPETVRDEKFLPKLKQHLRAKTTNQAAYIKAIKANRITFACGSPGTGKTFIAIGIGAYMLSKGLVKRIVLTRPMVHCGEPLGFLPGGVDEKTKEFVAPLTEALDEFFERADIDALIKHDRLKVIPIGVMRGRSIKDSLVIVDEGQNCTSVQLRMILTRIESTSRMVLCGDGNQSDITNSQFYTIANGLRGIDGVGVVNMTLADNQRDKIVAEIDMMFERCKW